MGEENYTPNMRGAGGISSGTDVAAAITLGADFPYLGTHFIAVRESLASDSYKLMLVGSGAEDLVLTAYFTGVTANDLKQSVANAGIDPEDVKSANPDIQFGNEEKRAPGATSGRARQGVGAIDRVQSTADLVAELEEGYRAAASLQKR